MQFTREYKLSSCTPPNEMPIYSQSSPGLFTALLPSSSPPASLCSWFLPVPTSLHSLFLPLAPLAELARLLFGPSPQTSLPISMAWAAWMRAAHGSQKQCLLENCQHRCKYLQHGTQPLGYESCVSNNPKFHLLLVLSTEMGQQWSVREKVI